MEEILKNGVKCHYCGQVITDLEEDEGVINCKCENCGHIYIVYTLSEDEQSYYDHYKGKEKPKRRNEIDPDCPLCGTQFIISGNFSRSDIVGDVDTEEVDEYGLPVDDTITYEYTCSHCGTSMSMIPPKPSEEKLYKIYEKHE